MALWEILRLERPCVGKVEPSCLSKILPTLTVTAVVGQTCVMDEIHNTESRGAEYLEMT